MLLCPLTRHPPLPFPLSGFVSGDYTNLNSYNNHHYQNVTSSPAPTPHNPPGHPLSSLAPTQLPLSPTLTIPRPSAMATRPRLPSRTSILTRRSPWLFLTHTRRTWSDCLYIPTPYFPTKVTILQWIIALLRNSERGSRFFFTEPRISPSTLITQPFRQLCFHVLNQYCPS